ncbi:MAG: cytochrome c [Bacteroidota bacterium]|nr:cytochrome c [Bacteroidota bacterium]
MSIIAMSIALISACGGGNDEKVVNDPPTASSEPAKEVVETPTDPMENKGVGPVKEVSLGELDPALAEQGKELFESKCTACHKVDKRYIGPALQGVTERRTPEWIMNMILNPENMIQKDPIAKELLAEANGAPMANQNLTEDQARLILEYFRSLEK